MNEETIQLSDITAIIRRHLVSVVITTILCVSIALAVSLALRKQYKSKAVLDIPSSYFRNPLVSDLISDLTDPSELAAQRNGLLRLALGDEFLDSLGEKYGLYNSAKDNPTRVVDRETLLKRIEYFSINPTSFQIGMQGPDPRQVFDVLNDVLTQMTYTLIEERYRTLVRARDAIQKQVEFLSQSLLKIGSGAPQVGFLQSELKKIETNMRALQGKYTANHPELSRLRQRAENVRDQLRQAIASTPDMTDEERAGPFPIPDSKQPAQDIYNDLLKKLSNLNIILEMERDRDGVSYLSIIEKPQVPTSPVFPNKRTFLLMGFVVGLALSFIQVAYSELRRNSFLSPEKAAEMFDAPLIGELPILVSRERKLLLTGPLFRLSSALPSPEGEMKRETGQ